MQSRLYICLFFLVFSSFSYGSITFKPKFGPRLGNTRVTSYTESPGSDVYCRFGGIIVSAETTFISDGVGYAQVCTTVEFDTYGPVQLDISMDNQNSWDAAGIFDVYDFDDTIEMDVVVVPVEGGTEITFAVENFVGLPASVTTVMVALGSMFAEGQLSADRTFFTVTTEEALAAKRVDVSFSVNMKNFHPVGSLYYYRLGLAPPGLSPPLASTVGVVDVAVTVASVIGLPDGTLLELKIGDYSISGTLNATEAIAQFTVEGQGTPGQLDCSISFDRQHYIPAGKFVFYSTGAMSAIKPAVGLVGQSTSTRLTFDAMQQVPAYRMAQVKFDGVVASCTRSSANVYCTTPVLNTTGASQISLSWNNQQFEDVGTFTLYSLGDLDSITPPNAQFTGGTLISVRFESMEGVALAPDSAAVMLGDTLVSAQADVAASSVSFVVPQADDPAVVPLAVSLSGQHFIHVDDFLLFGTPYYRSCALDGLGSHVFRRGADVTISVSLRSENGLPVPVNAADFLSFVTCGSDLVNFDLIYDANGVYRSTFSVPYTGQCMLTALVAQEVVASSPYTVSFLDAPTGTSVTPSLVHSGSDGTLLVIAGTHLSGHIRPNVRVGGIDVEVSLFARDRLTVVLPTMSAGVYAIDIAQDGEAFEYCGLDVTVKDVRLDTVETLVGSTAAFARTSVTLVLKGVLPQSAASAVRLGKTVDCEIVEFVSENELRCEIPEQVPGKVSVVYTTDGTNEALLPEKFNLFDQPFFTSVTPDVVHTDGGVTLDIVGAGFVDSGLAFCSLRPDGGNANPATINSWNSMTCMCPSMPESGDFTLYVSLDGISYSSTTIVISVFGDVRISAPSPTYGTSAGGSLVQVFVQEEGPSKFSNDNLLCYFGDQAVGGTGDSGLVSCITPLAPGGAALDVQFAVSLDGGIHLHYSEEDFFFFGSVVDAEITHRLWFASIGDSAAEAMAIVGRANQRQAVHTLETKDEADVPYYVVSTFSLEINAVSLTLPDEVTEDMFRPRCEVCGGFVSGSFKSATNTIYCPDVEPLFLGECGLRLSFDGQLFERVEDPVYMANYMYVDDFGPSLVSQNSLGQAVVVFKQPLRYPPHEAYCWFGGGLESQVPAVSFSKANVTCDIPADMGNVDVRTMQISFNKLQWISAGPVHGCDELVVGEYGPTLGPTEGGTELFFKIGGPCLNQFNGSAFSMDVICRVESEDGSWSKMSSVQRQHIVSYSEEDRSVSCIIPPSPTARNVSVYISVDGGLNFMNQVTYRYVPDPLLLDVTPNVALLATPREIVFTGENFEAGDLVWTKCRFGPYVVPAKEITPTSITCWAPPVGADLATKAAIALDGQTFEIAGEISFWFYSRPVVTSVTPALTHYSANVNATAIGTGFLAGAYNPQCRLDSIYFTKYLPGTVISPHEFVCLLPEIEQTITVDFAVSMDGEEFSQELVQISYLGLPQIYSLEPSTVHGRGGSVVTIHGTGMGDMSAMWVRLGTAASVPVTILNDVGTAATFVAPATSCDLAVDDRECVLDFEFSESPSGPWERMPGVTVTYYLYACDGAVLQPRAGVENELLEVEIVGGPYPDTDTILGIYRGDTYPVERKSAALLTMLINTGPGGVSEDIEIAFDAQQYDTVPQQFACVSVAAIGGMFPPVVDYNGDTVVTFLDYTQAPTGDTKCRFCGGAATPVLQASPGEDVTCQAPAGIPGNLCTVELTVDGQLWLEVGEVLFIGTAEIESADPAVSPVAGGSVVTVAVAEFPEDSLVSTRVSLNGTLLPDSDVVLDASLKTLVFTTATSAAGLVGLQVSFDAGQHLSEPSTDFVFYAPPVVDGIAPSMAPKAGATVVDILGSGFVPGISSAACRFGGSAVVEAVVPSSALIQCTTPQFAGASTSIEFALDSQTFVAVPDTLSLYPAVRVFSITPNEGESFGFTSVVVRGSGFIETDDMRIKFGGADGMGVVNFLNDTALQVMTPPHIAGSAEVSVSINGRDFHKGTASFVFIDNASESCRSIEHRDVNILEGERVNEEQEAFPDLISRDPGATVSVNDVSLSQANFQDLVDGDFCCKPTETNFGTLCGVAAFPNASGDAWPRFSVHFSRPVYVNGIVTAWNTPCKNLPSPIYYVYGGDTKLKGRLTLGTASPCPFIQSDLGVVAICADYFSPYVDQTFSVGTDSMLGSDLVWLYEIEIHGMFFDDIYRLVGEYNDETPSVRCVKNTFVPRLTITAENVVGVSLVGSTPQELEVTITAHYAPDCFTNYTTFEAPLGGSSVQIMTGGMMVLDDLYLTEPKSGCYALRADAEGDLVHEWMGVFEVDIGPPVALKADVVLDPEGYFADEITLLPNTSVSMIDAGSNVVTKLSKVMPVSVTCDSATLVPESPIILFMPASPSVDLDGVGLRRPLTGEHTVVMEVTGLEPVSVSVFVKPGRAKGYLVTDEDGLDPIVSSVASMAMPFEVCLIDIAGNLISEDDVNFFLIEVEMYSVELKRVTATGVDYVSQRCQMVDAPMLVLPRSGTYEIRISGALLTPLAEPVTIVPGTPAMLRSDLTTWLDFAVSDVTSLVPPMVACIHDLAGNVVNSGDSSVAPLIANDSTLFSDSGSHLPSGCVSFFNLLLTYPRAGDYYVEFVGSGLSPAAQTFSVFPGPPRSLVVQYGDGDALAQSRFDTSIGPFKVILFDLADNVCWPPEHATDLSVRLVSRRDGSLEQLPELAGPTTSLSDQGVAYFNDLVLKSPVVGEYVLEFYAADPLVSVVSILVEVVPGPPVAVEVASAVLSVPCNPMTFLKLGAVCLVDAGSNVATGFPANVSVEWSATTEKQRELFGNATDRWIDGCQEVGDLFIRAPPVGVYKLNVFSNEVDNATVPIDIVAGPPTSLRSTAIDSLVWADGVVAMNATGLPSVTVCAHDAGGTLTKADSNIIVLGESVAPPQAGVTWPTSTLLFKGRECVNVSGLGLSCPVAKPTEMVFYKVGLSPGPIEIDIRPGPPAGVVVNFVGMTDNETANYVPKLRAQVYTHIPPIEVTVVDECGNTITEGIHDMCLGANVPKANVSGTYWQCDRKALYELSDLYMYKPVLGTHAVYFSVYMEGVDYTLTGFVGVDIIPGEPAHLRLGGTLADWHDNTDTLPVSPVLEVVDELGNVCYDKDVPVYVDVYPPAAIMGDYSVVAEKGRHEFETFSFKGLHESNYQLNFKSPVDSALAVSSDTVTVTECGQFKVPDPVAPEECVCDAGYLYVPPKDKCTECPKNEYKGTPINSQSCAPCPAFTDTGGATAVDHVLGCRCVAGFYDADWADRGSHGMDCKGCPEGGFCLGNNTLKAQGEYWISSKDLTTVHACLSQEACPGGEADACADGYLGVLCAECTDGFGKNGQDCTECPSNLVAIRNLLGGFFLTCLILFIQTASALDAFDTSAQLKDTLLGYIQMMGILAQFKISWPGDVADLFEAENQVALGFGVRMMECLFAPNFFGRYAIMILSPFLFWAVITFLYRQFDLLFKGWRKLLAFVLPSTLYETIGLHSEEDDTEESGAIPRWRVGLVISLLYFHPFVVQFTLQCFDCVEVADIRYLVDDVTILCGTSQHNLLMVFGALVGVFYVIGLPVGIFIILKRNHQSIKRGDVHTLVFMTNCYKPHRYYWSIVGAVRKLLAAGAAVAFNSNTRHQIFAAFWLGWIALLLQWYMKPGMVPLASLAGNISLIASLTLLSGAILLTDPDIIGTPTADNLAMLLFAVNMCVIFVLVLMAVGSTAMTKLLAKVQNLYRKFMGLKPLEPFKRRRQPVEFQEPSMFERREHMRPATILPPMVDPGMHRMPTAVRLPAAHLEPIDQGLNRMPSMITRGGFAAAAAQVSGYSSPQITKPRKMTKWQKATAEVAKRVNMGPALFAMTPAARAQAAKKGKKGKKGRKGKRKAFKPKVPAFSNVVSTYKSKSGVPKLQALIKSHSRQLLEKYEAPMSDMSRNVSKSSLSLTPAEEADVPGGSPQHVSPPARALRPDASFSKLYRVPSSPLATAPQVEQIDRSMTPQQAGPGVTLSPLVPQGGMNRNQSGVFMAVPTLPRMNSIVQNHGPTTFFYTDSDGDT